MFIACMVVYMTTTRKIPTITDAHNNGTAPTTMTLSKNDAHTLMCLLADRIQDSDHAWDLVVRAARVVPFDDLPSYAAKELRATDIYACMADMAEWGGNR